jgi:four helix bundle protein
LNVEVMSAEKVKYDLEGRLLEFAVRVIKLSESLPETRAGNHVAGQLLRSGTAPLPMHGEAQGAESPRDFQHKLRLALKELRETQRWLKLAQAVPLVKPASKLDPIIQECDELIRIFVASIRTSESKTKKTR